MNYIFGLGSYDPTAKEGAENNGVLYRCIYSKYTSIINKRGLVTTNIFTKFHRSKNIIRNSFKKWKDSLSIFLSEEEEVKKNKQIS